MVNRDSQNNASMRRIHGTLALTLTLALGGLGCAKQQMVVPAGLAGNSQGVIVERPAFTSAIGTQTFQMGEFAATNVDLGGKTTDTRSAGPFSASQSSQKFSFGIARAEKTAWNVSCEISQAEKSIGGFTTGGPELKCSVTDAGIGKSGNIDVALWKNVKEGEPAGKLVLGDSEMGIAITKERVGTAPAMHPSGYVFLKNGQQLGAVDVLNQGVIHLGKSTSEDERLELVTAGVALLIAAGQTNVF